MSNETQDAVKASRDEWRRIAEYGLHLAMYGERAPGGDETWSEFERLVRKQADADAGSGGLA